MSGDYVRGEMDISTQESTWTGFMKVTQWTSFILVLILAYAIFTITMGMHWVVALGLLAAFGIVGGLLMGMGTAWVATVIGLGALAVFIQIIIMVSKALLN